MTIPSADPVPVELLVAVRREPRWSNHVEPPAPVADRRLTGEHWWDPDRLAHEADHPRFCPSCGAGLDGDRSIAVEYWQDDRRIYHTACFSCGWTGDIARIDRMVGPEAPHDTMPETPHG